MSDPSLRHAGEEARATAHEARAAAEGLRAEASGAASEVAGQARGVLEEAKAQGAEVLGVARERVEGVVEGVQEAGAERALGIAGAIRRAADDLDRSSPEIAGPVRAAADSIEQIAASLRDRSVGDLVGTLNDFARSQPVAFFGVAAIAGFAFARFAKSSSRPDAYAYSGGRDRALPPGVSRGPGYRAGGGGGVSAPGETPGLVTPQPTANAAPGWLPAGPGDTREARPMTMAAASLGGAAAHRPTDARPGSMPTGEEVTR